MAAVGRGNGALQGPPEDTVVDLGGVKLVHSLKALDEVLEADGRLLRLRGVNGLGVPRHEMRWFS